MACPDTAGDTMTARVYPLHSASIYKQYDDTGLTDQKNRKLVMYKRKQGNYSLVEILF